MKRRIFFTLAPFLFTCISNLHAQTFTPEVIASSGTFVTSSSGSMSWTLGEVMTETYSSAGNSFTQGFQQPDTSNILSVTDLSPETISIYPNPVKDGVTIDLNGSAGDHIVYIYSMSGEIITSEMMTNGQDQLRIPLGSFANGIYLLRIMNTETLVTSSFIINKAQ